MKTFWTSSASGFAAGLCVVFIWSFWLIVSRIGATSSLTIFDLAAIRYGVSALVSIPFVLYFKPWKDLKKSQIVILTFILGPIYILFVFAGFIFAPAAHGGIFMNGVLPIFTLSIGIACLGQKPISRKIIGALIILGATFLLGTDGEHLDLSQSWKGDVCFLIGAAFFAVYVTLSRLWGIRTIDILLCGALLNGLIYLPIWALFLPSGLGQAEPFTLTVPIIYQGLVPNLLGLILIAHASKTVGTDATSALVASVPALGAVLGVWLLEEHLSVMGWFAVTALTLGLFMITLSPRQASSPQA